MYFKEHPDEFFTATNLNWLHVLASDYHKQILIEALKHRTDNGQLTINAFVIMPNRFHIIWRIHNGVERGDFQRDLMKFTARSLLKFMLMNDDPLLPQLKVKAADRQQQVWERNPLPLELDSEKIFMQKLNYMHNNPLQPKWRLCSKPEHISIVAQNFTKQGLMILEY